MASHRYFRHALLAAAVLVPLIGAAQTSGRDPLDPRAAVADAPYQSAFAEYQTYQDPEVGSWRSANDSVGQAAGQGGHNMDGMQGKGGRKEMDGMPGHRMSDMGKMKEKAATPGKKSEPAGAAPKAMQDHSGMQKQ